MARALGRVQDGVEGHTPWTPDADRPDRAPVDLVIADLAMPGADGFALIQDIRRRHGRVPAIAVSALARPEDRLRALEAGFDEFIPKPLQADRLLAAIRHVGASYEAPGSANTSTTRHST